jgi:RNase P subunit RPR2
MPKRKYVKLTGRRKVIEATCPRCGHRKRMEYRKNGSDRRICGASELTKSPHVA